MNLYNFITSNLPLHACYLIQIYKTLINNTKMINLIKLADVKDLLPLLDNEEITTSKFAQLLNERANDNLKKFHTENVWLLNTKQTNKNGNI